MWVLTGVSLADEHWPTRADLSLLMYRYSKDFVTASRRLIDRRIWPRACLIRSARPLPRRLQASVAPTDDGLGHPLRMRRRHARRPTPHYCLGRRARPNRAHRGSPGTWPTGSARLPSTAWWAWRPALGIHGLTHLPLRFGSPVTLTVRIRATAVSSVTSRTIRAKPAASRQAGGPRPSCDGYSR